MSERKGVTPKSAVYLGWRGSEASGQACSILLKYFDVKEVHYFSRGDNVDQQVLCKNGADFIFSFGPLILKKPLLERARIAAINFHPAPSWYPGRKGPDKAVANREEIYAVTSHLMDEEIDHGSILNEIFFSIRNMNPKQIYDSAFERMGDLVEETVKNLQANNWIPKPNGSVWQKKEFSIR